MHQRCLLVGSVDYSINGFDLGKAFLYQRDNDSGLWELTFSSLPQDNDDNERYGAGVAISADGNAFAIGARGDRYDAGFGLKNHGSVWSNAPDQ